jgi:hypothetical protein
MWSSAADPNRPEVIARVASDAEAAAIVTALDACGIKAICVGQHISSFQVQVPTEMSIVVRASEAQAAREALEQIRRELDEPTDE